MIDRFTKQDLLSLVQKQNAPCVSIYLATKKTGREIYGPATQLKKLAGTAKQRLSSNWMQDTDANTFLKPITKLIENKDFWQDVDDGLALFLNPDGLQKWRGEESFADQVLVGRQFFVRPILATIGTVEPFFVLSLSQNKVELYDADETKIAKSTVPGMPKSVEAALDLTSVERGSSVHTGSREHKGKQGGVFHGIGGKPDSSKQDAKYFYRQVNQALRHFLGDSRKPIVLACTADQASIFRGINTYPYLLDETVTGSSDKLTDSQLLVQALPRMKEHMRKSRESAFATYQENANTPRTLSEASAIIAAAHIGKIDKLFVNETACLPGEFNPVDRTITYNTSTQDHDKDLVEETIAQTLLHRGEVYALTENLIPDEQPMVATLRY